MAFRRRKTTVAVWLLILVIVGAFVGLFAKSFDDAFELPGSESQEALDSMRLTFPQAAGAGGSLLVVGADGAHVDQGQYKTAIEDAVDRLKKVDQVDSVTSPFDEFVKGNINDDGNAALINIQYDGALGELGDQTRAQLGDQAKQLQDALPAGATVTPGGEIYKTTSVHISWVEGIGVVVAFFVLIFTFGSMLAAGIPLITALVGVMLGLMGIVGLTAFSTVSSTAPMLALMLGLAVGIDYALFIISRARTFMREGHNAEESVSRANATAGSAVVFAGVTVIIALVGLSITGMPFIAVMGFGAAATVAIAVAVALTLVPAILGFVGERINPLRKEYKKLTRRAGKAAGAEVVAGTSGPEPGEGHPGEQDVWDQAHQRANRPTFATRFYRGWVSVVTKFPLITIIVVVGALSAFAIPASKLQLALPDNGGEPVGTPARTTFDLISEEFGPGFNGPLVMTADIVTSDDPLGDIEKITDDIEAIDGVKQVVLAVPNENADTAMFQIVPETGPSDPATERVVEELRDLEPKIMDEYGYATAVTGATAVAIDVSSQLGRALIPFGVFVVGLSIVLLMMVFRSIWVPIKATAGFLLSVAASFGVVEMVFVEGIGANALNLEHQGPVISFLPIILMGILFGLAMDYEVFLVSGMRESYAHGTPAREAVRKGFMNSAAVVTAAAIIMFSVFAAFVPTGETIIKSIALGLAVGIAVDAFLVRMTLVPAVMMLLGKHAWWLPKWLDRLLPRFDVEGEGLYHQVKMQNWPETDTEYRVYGENLSVHGAGGPLFENVNVALEPGEILVVGGTGRSALLLALAGRAPLEHGELKINGYVLPEQANKVRRQTPFITLAPGDETLTPTPDYIARFITKLPPVVIIDRADAPQDHKTAQVVTKLIDVACSRGSTVILGLNNPDVDWMIPPGTDYTHLNLDEHNRGTYNHLVFEHSSLEHSSLDRTNVEEHSHGTV